VFVQEGLHLFCAFLCQKRTDGIHHLASGLEQGCSVAQEFSLLPDKRAEVVLAANPGQFRMTADGAGC
jgi:hypothetical protein